VGPHRKRDVFGTLDTQIGEFNPYLPPHVIVNGRRDADAAGICNALKLRRNIHAIAKNAIRLDNHVADVDADTEGNSVRPPHRPQ
jgi:hypothetical protein